MRTPPKRRWTLRSRSARNLIYQLLLLALIGLLIWFLAHNTARNMAVRGIQSGFDFLFQTAGFDIGEGLLDYDSSQPYWRAFLVGLTNTLRVAVLGIILTTLIGTLIGIGRLSRNALLSGLCGAYVEFFRNVPVLLQLLMWYLLFTEILPAADAAWRVDTWLGPVFLSKGGLGFPAPVASASGWVLDLPRQGEFAVEQGGALTPEFLALLIGLTIYTAAFVAEVVRAGIQSVPRGQTEAAASLGLSRAQAMRLIQLPQALRVIIPPMTNQYLNLTKNSSLAVAIGYPDVVSIANTSINQSGRAVECISIIMLIYLCTSLGTSLLMNWYNARAAILER